jgi:DNA-binding CsgD family transcriptional regulator
VGPKEERLERLEESVRLLDGSPARLLLATAFIDLGEALRRSGQPMAVSTLPLRRGLDIAFGLQAAPLVSRALNELKLSGARPRRTAVSGPGSLTPAEGRVVALAANGCTNSAIASELFLTEKTVEGHLVRSYRKLKVRSRRELKALLQSPERQPHDPNVKGPGPTTAQDAVAGRPAVQRLLADDDAGIALDDLMGKEQIPADSRKQSAPGTGRTT